MEGSIVSQEAIKAQLSSLGSTDTILHLAGVLQAVLQELPVILQRLTELEQAMKAKAPAHEAPAQRR